MKKIVTRFAPSPTGFLHIGAIRSALFAYLFARANKGKFILRIEDTDQTRLVENAVDDIQKNLSWLGIEWDEGPVFQSKRLEHYKKYAEEMIEKGDAYYCFCTKARLDKVREEQTARKDIMVGYDGFCKEIPLEVAKQRLSAGEKPVIRFKIPKSGKTVLNDLIVGTVEFENNTLDDLVILKADGFPTYHLAHVVDDHLMQVSHVHRGVEWIPSAPKHILMFKSLGWEPPQYVHLPVILSQDGGKLSKRKGATFVSEFREKGYLKEAMVNFTVLLGWSFDDKEEFFSLEKLKELFCHEKISKASPVFSFDKLDWFNGMYIRQKGVEELAELCLPYMRKAEFISANPSAEETEYLKAVCTLYRERIKFLSDLPIVTEYFFREEIDYPDPKLLIPKKTSIEDTAKYLSEVIKKFEELKVFTIQEIENSLRNLSETLGIKPGSLFMPIRIAVSGSTASPGIFEMVAVLGKEKVLKRLGKALKILKTG